jgi:hypothetical protein
VDLNEAEIPQMKRELAERRAEGRQLMHRDDWQQAQLSITTRLVDHIRQWIVENSDGQPAWLNMLMLQGQLPQQQAESPANVPEPGELEAGQQASPAPDLIFCETGLLGASRNMADATDGQGRGVGEKQKPREEEGAAEPGAQEGAVGAPRAEEEAAGPRAEEGAVGPRAEEEAAGPSAEEGDVGPRGQAGSGVRHHQVSITNPWHLPMPFAHSTHRMERDTPEPDLPSPSELVPSPSGLNTDPDDHASPEHEREVPRIRVTSPPAEPELFLPETPSPQDDMDVDVDAE